MPNMMVVEGKLEEDMNFQKPSRYWLHYQDQDSICRLTKWLVFNRQCDSLQRPFFRIVNSPLLGGELIKHEV